MIIGGGDAAMSFVIREGRRTEENQDGCHSEAD
jgi:hypothetical protein